MRYLLFLFCCLFFNIALAAPPLPDFDPHPNLDPNDGPILQFLPGTKKFWPDPHGRSTPGGLYKVDYRRPLTEFKIGKKYCLWNSSNWDEECQDAAFHYAYGANWRQYEEAVKAFLSSVYTDDINIVKPYYRSDYIATARCIEFNKYGDSVGYEFKDYLDLKTIRKLFPGLTYTNMMISSYRSKGAYDLVTNRFRPYTRVGGPFVAIEFYHKIVRDSHILPMSRLKFSTKPIITKVIYSK